ncbi:unnamed protein product [Phaeothamnion confervicola]
MKEMREVALWGALLYIVFLAIVAVRLAPFLRGQPSKITLSSTDGIKFVFHLLLLVAAFLELVNYSATAIEGHGTREGYSCHLLALWLQLLAFSTVIVLWSKTLRPQPAGAAARRGAATAGAAAGVDAPGRPPAGSCRERMRTNSAAITVGMLDAAVLALTLVVIITHNANKASSYPYILLSLLHGLVLFALASWLVVYGLRLQKRVMDHPRWEPLDSGSRLRILLRINGVLIVCAICFLLRVAMLLSTLFMSSNKRMEELSGFAFEALARWVPTLLPAIALTHIMRKAEGAAADSSAVSASATAGSGKPGLPGRGGGGRGLLDGQVKGLEEPLLSRSGRGGEAVLAGGINGDSPAADSFVYNMVRQTHNEEVV